MIKHFRSLDRILRGQATRLPLLRNAEIDVSAPGLCMTIVVLGLIYGACMGSFAMLRTWGTVEQQDGIFQMMAAMGKVPALFLLTVLVTLPSLYVFNTLVGSRLTLTAVVRLIVAALAVVLAILASFGTIIAFFSFTTTSYPFMVLLNVLVFTISGILGLMFLLQTLHRLSIAQAMMESDRLIAEANAAPPPTFDPATGALVEPPAPASDAGSGALAAMDGRPPGNRVRNVFRIWIIMFALVGSQMAWVLRPFIGNPNQPFTFFRLRESNFFEGVARALYHLFGGSSSGRW